MRILFISTLYPTHKNDTCVTFALHEFVKEWQKMEHEILVLRPHWNKWPFDKNKDMIHKVQCVSIFGIRIPGIEYYLVNPYNILNTTSFVPDIIVAHMYKSYLWAGKIATRYNVPFVVGIHGSDLFLTSIPLIRRRFRRIFRSANGIAIRSPILKRRFLRIFPELTQKSFLALSGIVSSTILPRKLHIEKIHQWKGTKKIHFLTAARLDKLKNIDINLKVLARFPKEVQWKYTIIGDGNERGKLERLIKNLGLKSKVKIIGWKPRPMVLDYMSQSDIFIMVSAPETFGLAYLDAMATGNIIIGTLGWGIDGIIVHEVNGFLCKPRDEFNLYNTLSAIIYQYPVKKLELIADNAYKTVSQHTQKHCASAYLQKLSRIHNQYTSNKLLLN